MPNKQGQRMPDILFRDDGPYYFDNLTFIKKSAIGRVASLKKRGITAIIVTYRNNPILPGAEIPINTYSGNKNSPVYGIYRKNMV